MGPVSLWFGTMNKHELDHRCNFRDYPQGIAQMLVPKGSLQTIEMTDDIDFSIGYAHDEK